MPNWKSLNHKFMHNYNTTRPVLLFREYGRSIQLLIQRVCKIPDKALRTQKIYDIIKLMGIISNNDEPQQKHLEAVFMVTDYQLDIDIACKPPKKCMNSREYVVMPRLLPIRYKYYGRNIELLIQKVVKLPTMEERSILLVSIIKLMRRFGNIWSNDNMYNEKILRDIQSMLPHAQVLDENMIRNCINSVTFNHKSKAFSNNKVASDRE